MVTRRSAWSRQQIEQRAREVAAERTGAQELEVSRVVEDVVPSTRERLSRVSLRQAGVPNAPSVRVILDAYGDMVDVAAIERREGIRLFATPTAPIDLSRASEALVSIDPPRFEARLGCCRDAAETIRVHIPATGAVAKADVYFLADTTGSMSEEIDAVRTSGAAILSALAGLGLDLAFGVGSYRDFPGPASDAFSHQLAPTTVVADVAAAINSWSASGGGDTPEAQLFALNALAEGPGGAIGWRSGSKRIIVWFGDAPGHDPVCAAISGLAGDITEASVTTRLTSEAISVLAISLVGGAEGGLDADPTVGAGDYVAACGAPGGAAGQATRITAATGGTLVSGIDDTTIVSTIIALVSAAVAHLNNVSLVPDAALAPFVTSISPAGGYGPLPLNTDHDLTFTVTFGHGGVECADHPQTFSGTLAVVADGVQVAVQHVTVIIEPCVYVYSVQMVCGEQREDDRCTTVHPGRYATAVTLHNTGCRDAHVRKLFVPVVINEKVFGREPQVARPQAKDEIVLPRGCVTMDDCCRIDEWVIGPGAGAQHVFGVLEIRSDVELVVEACYTAGKRKGVSSIDVRRIPPQRC